LEDGGRTIWVWRENLSSAIGDRAEQKKKAAVVGSPFSQTVSWTQSSSQIPHPISEIYPCNGLPQRLLVLSPAGDLTVVDPDLKIRSTLPPSPNSGAVLRSFVFRNSSFSASVAVLLLERSQNATTSIRILDISPDDEAREIGTSDLPINSDVCPLCCSWQPVD
jgi:gephyrin